MQYAACRKRSKRGGGYGSWTATVVRTIVTSRRCFMRIKEFVWLILNARKALDAPFCVFVEYAPNTLLETPIL